MQKRKYWIFAYFSSPIPPKRNENWLPNTNIEPVEPWHLQVSKNSSSPKERYLSVPNFIGSLVRSIELFATKLVIKRTILCVENNFFVLFIILQFTRSISMGHSDSYERVPLWANAWHF